MEYLDCFFADPGVAPGDDDDFPGQIRNAVDSEIGLWSEVTLDDKRVEYLPEDAKGGEQA